MNNNRWWYRAKGRLERGLDALWVEIVVALSWLVTIGVFAVVLIGLYVLLRGLLELL